MDYNYSFTADIVLPDGSNIPFPVSRTGGGEWYLASNDSKIFLDEDGETYTFDVISNEPNKQVLQAVLPQTYLIYTIDVNTILTLERK